ncbi:Copper binding protein, plastocyanin/azurin family [Methanosarcina sp. MTP4]|uniref:cupredoxin domain-containing protein n=1 Tax=Methanosarcina sp. MTP4 TaxID=1434100 RepID=UPI000615E2D3|nr:cupredoxin domain-containing protein [Methanosarcina sp. MTP4]AKB26110.1 Copper binding protein, plastocyanin/azurin family [Methanosarcina sp. MTP4]
MKNYNKPIILALLMVSILLMSTGLAAAKGPAVHSVNAANPTNKIVIYNTFTPETVDINAGESITWINYQRPKGPVTLVSEDGLWEEEVLHYGGSFSYTFEETGTYTFTLEETPEIKLTVNVNSAKTQKTGYETATETGISAAEPQPRGAETSAGEKLVKNNENEENGRNDEKKLVIYGTFVPEVTEIKAGDTVTWINFRRPKAPAELVSEDSLWEETFLHYGGSFSYTFEEPGTYTISLKDKPEIKSTIMVK